MSGEIQTTTHRPAPRPEVHSQQTGAEAEEAAMVYDRAAIQLRGPDVLTNFSAPALANNSIASSRYNSGEESSHNNAKSPKSLLQQPRSIGKSREMAGAATTAARAAAVAANQSLPTGRNRGDEQRERGGRWCEWGSKIRYRV